MTPWVLNHLWQSSVCTALAALLAQALRNHPARVRFWVWTTASLKFLVPLALLATLGNHLAWRPPTALPELQALRAAAQPFVASDVPAALPTAQNTQPSPLPVGPAVLGVMWLAGTVTVFAVWLARWARLLRVVLAATPGPSVGASLPMRWTSAAIEPGVFGVFRPVLLLPAGIAERLSPEQLEALVAHELCHARRRDNLWALLHMLVEAAFWFVPPVWWIGHRLIAERERACDEAVLTQGADPGEYGDAVVQVCRYYTGAPLPCVSGVTGADLKRRIADIVNYAGHRGLTWTAKLGMAALLAAVIAAPLAAGRLYAPWQQRSELPAPTLKFDVASVKARPAGPAVGMLGVSTRSPGRLVANCASLKVLVLYAYARDDHRYEQDVLGGPAWTDSGCGDNAGTFDIEATMPPDTTATQSHEMMRSLLAARFKLQVHVETRQEKVFALIVTPAGLTLKPSDPNNDPPTPPHSLGCPEDDRNCHMVSPGSWKFDDFARFESQFVGRPIINKTGLTGYYLITDYRWRGDDAENSSLPTFTELLKRWGLELRSEIGPVDYLVIDHAEMPTGT